MTRKYFVLSQRDWFILNDEKGIRCNSGAVPAAVISIKAANYKSLYIS